MDQYQRTARSRRGQKLGCSATATLASADLKGSTKARLMPQSCFKRARKQKGQAFAHSSSVNQSWEAD